MMSLEQVLDQLYGQMMPLYSGLVDVARAIAGFGALWYIAVRVWSHLARAEPIDVLPLLRPFVLGGCIALYPQVLNLMNGVLQPTVTATNNLVQHTNQGVQTLLDQESTAAAPELYVGDQGENEWYQYAHPDENVVEGVGDDLKFQLSKLSFNVTNLIRQWLSDILTLLFEAAALAIDTIRTFYLVVLSITGALSLGFSVYDGFRGNVQHWLSRYIQVYLWLPVGNIFGSIIGQVQQLMLQADLQEMQTTGNTYFGQTDSAYLIFLLIGIIGYLTVPSVTGYIVQGGGGYALLQRVTRTTEATVMNSTEFLRERLKS